MGILLLTAVVLRFDADPPTSADRPLPTVEEFLDQEDPAPPPEPGFFVEAGELLWNLGETFVLDVAYLVTAPLRPTTEGVLVFAGGVALIGVTMGLLDEPIRGFAQRNRHENLDQALGIVQNAMSRPAATGAGLTAIGLLVEDPKLQRTGLEILETDFAARLLTSAGKRLFGRSRPYTERGARSFKFLGGTEEGRRSFPSAGAQSAFSIAVPLAEEYEGTAWPYVAYGLASLASLQRIVDDAHWTSDVLASALLSVAIGKALVWLHRQDVHPPLVPWLCDADGDPVLGLALDRRF